MVYDTTKNGEKALLTDREKTLLDIIEGYATIKDAGEALSKAGISVDAAYKMVQRIRRKSRAWRIGVNQILAYRRKGGLLEKLLYTKE